MPLTTLDPNPALVVIDLQKGILGMPVLHPIVEILDRSARLAEAFRARGWPVVLVNVAGGAPGRTDITRPGRTFPPDFTDIVPELDQQPSDIVITKHRIGAFLGTSLDEILRQHGVTQVFLTGVATSNGVEATAWSAYDLGYNVVIVTDAVTDRDAARHQYSLTEVFPRISETDTTAALLAHLEV